MDLSYSTWAYLLVHWAYYCLPDASHAFYQDPLIVKGFLPPVLGSLKPSIIIHCPSTFVNIIIIWNYTDLPAATKDTLNFSMNDNNFGMHHDHAAS